MLCKARHSSRAFHFLEGPRSFFLRAASEAVLQLAWLSHRTRNRLPTCRQSSNSDGDRNFKIGPSDGKQLAWHVPFGAGRGRGGLGMAGMIAAWLIGWLLDGWLAGWVVQV